MDIEEIKQKIAPVLDRYDVVQASVFGSVARGVARVDSDVDILIEFGKTPGLVKLIRMEDELQQSLNKKVDVVIKGSEKPLIRPFIYKDLIKLYEQRLAV